MKVIFKRQVLKPGGTIVLERPAAVDFRSTYFKLLRSQAVGGKRLDFYGYGDSDIAQPRVP